MSINRLARNLNWIWIVIPRLLLDDFRIFLQSWNTCRKYAPNPSRTYLKRFLNMSNIYPKYVKIFVRKCPEHIQCVSRTFQKMSPNHKVFSWNSCHLLKLLSSVETVVICWNCCSLMEVLSLEKVAFGHLFVNTSSCWGFVYNESPGTIVVYSCSLLKVFWLLKSTRPARSPAARPAARSARPAARSARSADNRNY